MRPGEWFITGMAACLAAILAAMAAVIVLSWPLYRVGLYDPPKWADGDNPHVVTHRYMAVRFSGVLWALAAVSAAFTAIGYVIEVVAA